MIGISENTFQNVLDLYKKIDSNQNDIDKIYEEIQNFIKENIIDNDNENLYKKFNKAFSNYIYYEIELKDVEKKIEKRKNTSKWFINS
jgi:regulator of replication initiation timing